MGAATMEKSMEVPWKTKNRVTIWILFFSLLMWCITLIYLCILRHLCIFSINPTWSWYMILLVYCWIQFARILFRSFCIYVHHWYWPVIVCVCVCVCVCVWYLCLVLVSGSQSLHRMSFEAFFPLHIFWNSLWSRTLYNVWYNSPMKLPGHWLLLGGFFFFLISDSALLLILVWFIFSVFLLIQSLETLHF